MGYKGHGIINKRICSAHPGIAAWGSGFYGCAPEQVLAVLRRATLRDEEVTPQDRAWVRPIPEVAG